ncbi:amino acid permease [Nitrospira sp.]|nr:amino acid permease [Nitrospira sp.]
MLGRHFHVCQDTHRRFVIDSPPASVRRVGWFTAVCVLVSNIIGGGVFTTTGFLARDIGDPLAILSLWMVGAVLAVAGAMTYAELGSALPHAGGDYVYLKKAYGPVVGFLSGWTSFTIGFSAAIAASSVSFASYLLRAIRVGEDERAPIVLLALTLVWSLTALHAQGLYVGSWVQRLVTTVKVLAIAVFIIGGLWTTTSRWGQLAIDPHPSLEPGATAVALIFIVYCYLGWNVAGYIASEIEQPSRLLPRIMIGGTVFVAAVYLTLNVVYLSALPIPALAEPPILPVAEKVAAALWGPTAARATAALLAISIAGAVSAMVWAGPRAYWAMARDGLWSRWAADLDPRTQVPARAMWLQAVWTSILIVSGSFEQLVVYSGVVLAAFTALTVGAVLVLRQRAPDLPRPYRAPAYPWLPLGLIVGALGLVAYSALNRPAEAAWGLLTVLAGLPLYWWWRRSTDLPGP